MADSAAYGDGALSEPDKTSDTLMPTGAPPHDGLVSTVGAGPLEARSQGPDAATLHELKRRRVKRYKHQDGSSTLYIRLLGRCLVIYWWTKPLAGDYQLPVD